VQPRIGRGFTAEEEKEGHERVVIIADSLWRRHFQANPAIVGRIILLDGKPIRSSACFPPLFPSRSLRTWAVRKHVRKWRSTALSITVQRSEDTARRYELLGYGAPKAGITLARAQAELKVVQAAIDKQIEGNFDVHASMVPLMESMIGKSRQGLLL